MRLLVIDRLVGNAPALEEEIVFVVLEQPAGKIAIGVDGLQTQEMKRTGINLGGVPVLQLPLIGIGFGRHVGNPGVVAKLDERRVCAGGVEAAVDRRLEPGGGVPGLRATRISDLFERAAEEFESRVHVRLIKSPDPSPVPSFSGPANQSAEALGLPDADPDTNRAP